MYLDLRSEGKNHDDYQNQLECSEINVGFFDNRLERAAHEEEADQFRTPRVLDQEEIGFYSRPDPVDAPHRADQGCMRMIPNAQPNRQAKPDESSDIQTPYGLIEINDEDLSDNIHSQKGYHQQQFGELI